MGKSLLPISEPLVTHLGKSTIYRDHSKSTQKTLTENEDFLLTKEEEPSQEAPEQNPAQEVLTGKNSNQECTSEEGEWNGHQEKRCSAAARTHNDNDFGITRMTPITPAEQNEIDRLEEMVFNGNTIATTELLNLGRAIAARDPFLSKATRQWQCFLRPRYFPIAQMVWTGPAPRNFTPEVMAGADAYRTLQLKRPATEGEVATYLTNLIGGLSRMKTADEQQTAALALESRYQEGVYLMAQKTASDLVVQQAPMPVAIFEEPIAIAPPSQDLKARLSAMGIK